MIDEELIDLLRDKTQLVRFNRDEVRSVFQVLYALGYEIRRADPEPAPVTEPAPPPVPSEVNDLARAEMQSQAQQKDEQPTA